MRGFPVSTHRLSRRPFPADQRGGAAILIVLSIAALFSFGIIAIDGAILTTTKNQLQAAADAAALAGASGLGSGTQALATQRAIDFAGFNRAVQDSLAPVAITAADVTFPTPTRVRVRTHRTAATGDPLRTYFLRVVDLMRPNTADVEAVATAEVVPICGSDCLKPWAVPDRWDDANGNGQYDAGEFYDPLLTGYLPPGDVGTTIILKVGNPNQAIAPGQFFPINYPPLGGPEKPLTGGDVYREWIAGCSPYLVVPGDSLQLEPGNMVGPTIQGVDLLVAADPGAYWDSALGAVAGSAFGQSPRIVKVPFFDPRFPPVSGRNYVHVAKIGAFFLESVGPGSQVVARFIRIATQGTACDPSAPPSFLMGLTLVE